MLSLIKHANIYEHISHTCDRHVYAKRRLRRECQISISTRWEESKKLPQAVGQLSRQAGGRAVRQTHTHTHTHTHRYTHTQIDTYTHTLPVPWGWLDFEFIKQFVTLKRLILGFSRTHGPPVAQSVERRPGVSKVVGSSPLVVRKFSLNVNQ